MIYNTLSGEKENIPDKKKINLFVCGPTVYDYAHIGHARTYIFFDFFAKYLRSQGFEVFYLQNITDIDDKIIKRAAEENKEPLECAAFFTNAYLEDMESLGIGMTPNKDEAQREEKILYARATEFIPEIIDQAERLVEKGYAYKIDGDGWYFDISKDEDYGKLSGRSITQAEDAVSRIDETVGKRNRGDFCLWKFSKQGEPVWKSKIGDGRPGWHIEDTAITEHFFGSQYDIHGGGIDLKFPHHEAEIAQQESASGKKPFVKIWMHTGQLLMDGKKMSKSLGNFITIREFLKKYPPEVLRWITLAHHYRSPMDFSSESAEQAKATIEKIKLFLAKLEFLAKENSEGSHAGADVVMEKTDKAFASALADDVNTPIAIAHIFSAIIAFEKQPLKVWNLDPATARVFGKYIREKLKILGFSFNETLEIPAKIHQLAAEREQSRANKQFVQSDGLRKEMDDLGYEVEDTPVGPFVYPK
jgi:cysteinyl-tRNA synthetase